jgi:hypothetical protein
MQQLSLIVDKKISAAQTAAGDVLAMMNQDIDTLKGKKSIDASGSSVPSLAAQASSSAQIYGMPPNSFPGQMPPPLSVYTEPVTLIQATGQTGPTSQTGQASGQTGAMVVTPPSPTPLATILGSAAPGRTNKMALYTPPHTSAGGTPQGSGPRHGPIPNATQTMSYTNPNTHSLASASHTSTSSSGYQADLYKFREEMANKLKSKLGVDLSSSRLYQKP